MYTFLMNMPPFQEVCLCGALRRAARKATRLYDEMMAESGLNISQLSQLRNINQAGEITVSELATKLELERTAMGRNLDVLEKRKLIRSVGAAEDARRRVVALTAAGRKALSEGLTAWEKAQVEMRKRLSREGIGSLEAVVHFANAKGR